MRFDSCLNKCGAKVDRRAIAEPGSMINAKIKGRFILDPQPQQDKIKLLLKKKSGKFFNSIANVDKNF